MTGSERIVWVVMCEDDEPGITASGEFATEAEANAEKEDFDRAFFCSAPHRVEQRTITEEPANA